MSHQITTLLLGLTLLFQARAFALPGTGAGQPRGYLGIYSDRLSEEKARLLGFDNAYGSYVTRVFPNSAAAAAGLQPFDYITGINEWKTTGEEDLTDLLHRFSPGEQVTVHFIRAGKKRQVEVTLGEEASWESASRTEAFLGVSPLDDGDEDGKDLGVRVEIVGNSTAEAMGLRHGDVILSINDHPMIDWIDITAAIGNLEAGADISLEYERDGRREEVRGKIASRASNEDMSEADQQAFLGVQTSTISEEKARKLGFDNFYGSYVTKVIPGTAAEKAGVRPFDYIFGVDEYRTGENQDLSQILHKFEAGDNITLHLFRQGKKRTLPATLGRPEDAVRESRDECSSPFLGIRHDHRFKPELGVGVTVVEGSTAAVMGLRDGDVITAINDFPIIDWQDISMAVNNAQVGQTVRVEYRRDGARRQGNAPIKSYCDTKGKEPPGTGGAPRDDERDYVWPGPDEGRPNREPSNLRVSVKNLSGGQAESLRQQGLDISSRNDLTVQDLSLTPDKSNGLFRLRFSLPDRGETAIQIFNQSGRQIYHYELGPFSGPFDDEVDLGQNGPGTYYLEVRQGSRSLGKVIELLRD